MQNLAKAILSYNSGVGPDVLVLQEIENIEVLGEFNRVFLGKAEYATIELLEGPDVRGIDTAVLSRLPLATSSTLHPVRWSLQNETFKRPTRSILEVQLVLNKTDILSVFALHFPSPRHPLQDRLDAFLALEKAAKASSSEVIIAAGDFNVVSRESDNFFGRYVAPEWEITHFVGCSDCRGTYYYKRDAVWSFLDAVIVSKTSAYQIIPSSIAIWDGVVDMRYGKTGIPNRFDTRTGQGYSDHLPLVLNLKKKKR